MNFSDMGKLLKIANFIKALHEKGKIHFDYHWDDSAADEGHLTVAFRPSDVKADPEIMKAAKDLGVFKQ